MSSCLTSSSSLCAVNERAQTALHARSCGNMSRDSMARRRGSRTLRIIEALPQPALSVNIHGDLEELSLCPQNLSSPAAPISIRIQQVSSPRQNHSSMPPSTTASPSFRSACRLQIWNWSTFVSIFPPEHQVQFRRKLPSNSYREHGTSPPALGP